MKSARIGLRATFKILTFLGLILPVARQALAAADYSQVTREILTIAKKNDIVVFGENHSLRDSRRILMLVLEKGFESGLIDGFATEYILADIDSTFQSYLSDPSADRETPAEAAFFAVIKEKGYVWVNDELNKDFFRFLRLEKLKNPALKICGLDESSSTDKAVRAERLKSMPAPFLSQLEKIFRLNVQKMAEMSGVNFDREPMMALHAVDCIAGAKKSILHMGSFHAHSARYDASAYKVKKTNDGYGWRSVSQFVALLLPQKKLVTMATALPVAKPGVLFDPFSLMFQKANQIFHKDQPEQISLMATYKASQTIKSTLKTADAFPIWPIWDYLILGPQGEFAPVWN